MNKDALIMCQMFLIGSMGFNIFSTRLVSHDKFWVTLGNLKNRESCFHLYMKEYELVSDLGREVSRTARDSLRHIPPSIEQADLSIFDK